MIEKKLSHLANKKVLDFYKSLPFNYYSDITKQIESVKNGQSNISANAPLEIAIKKSKTIVDVGCGAGWLSNSISYLYKDREVTGVDFNSVAVDRAKEVAKKLNLKTRFQVEDLFNYKPKNRFDLVVSIGVLMCTNDCMEAIRSLIKNMLKPGGTIYIGLYHTHGRKPFLEYFRKLQAKGYSEDKLLDEYTKLHSSLKDKVHIKSWFRDQVLHPHETLHTLKEILPVLDSEGMKLISTSINKFEPIKYEIGTGYDQSQIKEIFTQEEKMKDISEQALKDKRYYPGFFTFAAESKKN
tara:strand:- start:562 stop:1449 length:888 start_codon:yes stop_codon:yes gene_type:complete